ncbi:spindle pole body component 110-like [Anneissia japonica]|uniref:spindle pole body component 110-like n=1 Tax=Anneissia japonica TaxID=1529436 RepID=UPI0014255BB5|nr:spindle pole body component 110-like [Anneissia japonica]
MNETLDRTTTATKSTDDVCVGGASSESDRLRKKEEKIVSLKTVVQSIDVLKLLLNDYGGSIDSLKLELKKKNLSIEHLQFRLHRNKLDSSVDLKEHEVFVPGHDKEVLDQLLRDNVRFRTVLNSNYSSEEVAEAKKTIAALRKRIAELSFEVRTKDKELTEYLSATNSSDSEKDVAIRKLTSELKECYGQRSYVDDVRRTLCREIERMRSKIDDLVTAKIDVAREPRDYERREKDVGEQRNCGSLSPEDRCKVLEEQVSSLARENAELSKQLKEVISMNTRWQRYSDQREANVIKLTGEIQSLSARNEMLERDCRELRMGLDKKCRELDDLRIIPRQDC